MSKEEQIEQQVRDEAREFLFNGIQMEFNLTEGDLKAMMHLWFLRDPDPSASVIARIMNNYKAKESKEVDRLRAALRTIVNWNDDLDYEWGDPGAYAQQALTPKSTTK